MGLCFASGLIFVKIVCSQRSEMNILNRILFVLACLLLPMLWGVIVNWVYNFWSERSERKADDDTIFPDYQI
ncbi:MAG: hypothetical protein Tsb009_06880 [Planctomycetaceae bacterium]